MNDLSDSQQACHGGADRSRRPHDNGVATLARRHLLFGWYALLVFLVGGAVLEMFHGFKADLYLNVSNETRRLLWTLAHAHGTLLAIINIMFALTIRNVSGFGEAARALASRCLIAATILLPAGFFFGGIFITAGDAGLPVLLVPVGAVLLFVAVFIIARRVTSADSDDVRRNDGDRSHGRKQRAQKLPRA
jgi:hypothetical protein